MGTPCGADNRDGTCSPNDLLPFARNYVRRGYFVVPLPPFQSHPVLPNWQQLRIMEPNITEYFDAAGGIGLLLKMSGLVDIDCDCPEAVMAARLLLPATEMVHGHLSNRYSHFYYRVENLDRNESFVDPRRTGEKSEERSTLIELRVNGQTVVPPSFNCRSGEPVQWDVDGEPALADGIELRRTVAKIASAALLARYWPQGSRNFAAMAVEGMLLGSGWSVGEAKKFMLAVATAAHDEECASRLRSVDSTAKRVLEGLPVTGSPTLAGIVGVDIVAKLTEWLGLKGSVECREQNAVLHLTDLGNARRLIARHGQNLLYCHLLGNWLVWDGTRWYPDESGEVERLAKDTVGSIYAEAALSPDGMRREDLARHAVRSEAEPRIRAMVNLAKTEPTIPIAPEELDLNPAILICRNGALDLQTGTLLPHGREYRCTKQVTVPFEAEAKCPVWLTFLDRVLAGNYLLMEFLQRAVGYSLTGHTIEQVLFVLYGMGANGKSTFIETIRRLLGDYSRQADFETFLTKKSDGPRNDLARLKGARFLAAVEAAEGRRLDETVVKQVTGGDAVTARFLYHEQFEFRPQFKLWLAANHKPRVVGTDEAIWRRIRLIPFTVTIPADERDKRLLEKLERELPGIFAWAVQGCLDWQRGGLGEPAAVLTATQEYRSEMDTLGDFIKDCCNLGSQEKVTAAEIYQEFRKWCERNGEMPLCQMKLGTSLRDRGFHSTKVQGRRCWFGIGLSAIGQGGRDGHLPA